jgi:serine/threonine-protein kinase HipA
MISEREAYVYVQLPGTLTTVPAARLRVEQLPDRLYVGHFRYGDRYLSRQDAVELDPFALPLAARVYKFTRLKGIPGAMRDASPDAWGRRVIEHRLGVAPGELHELDYLLHGPADGASALTFGRTVEPPAPVRRYNRTHQLADLIRAAEAVEDGRPVPAHLLEQLEPGTSMGGARPKATVEDDGALWLAKFPERSDRFSLPRVEYATLELARRAGIAVCHARLERVGELDVLLLQRFDRERTRGGYLRHGMVSGLTVLDADDSHLDRAKWSYPLFADQLRRWSARSERDRRELYARMVFNAAVTNNDDHPRNHALLRLPDGWRLAPAYDVVPAPMVAQEYRPLALTVGRYGRAASLYNLLSQAERFGLAQAEARAVFDRVVDVVRGWRDVYRASGITERDCDIMAPAFVPASLFLDAPVDRPDGFG